MEEKYYTAEEFFESLQEKLPWYKEVYYFMHRIYYLLIEIPIRNIKFYAQKLFRKNHTADIEIWGLNYYLYRYILRKLQAFKDAPRMGYPCCFMDYDENAHVTKEKYNEDVKQGKITPGGPDKWEETLDEMIFAFEFLITDDECDKEKRMEFCKRYGLEDWISEDEVHFNDNLSKYYDRACKGLHLFAEHLPSLWD